MTFEAVLYFLKRGSVGRSLTTFPLVILSCNALLFRIKAANKLNLTLIIDSLLRFGLKYPCGERGIRTPGASQHDGFQDRCNRPLYHLSFC